MSALKYEVEYCPFPHVYKRPQRPVAGSKVQLLSSHPQGRKQPNALRVPAGFEVLRMVATLILFPGGHKQSQFHMASFFISGQSQENWWDIEWGQAPPSTSVGL